MQFYARLGNLPCVTTRVYVVYMFGKHIHALNLLNISIIRGVFPECVYVWRLILKKNRILCAHPSLILRSASVLPPFQNRCKAVSAPIGRANLERRHRERRESEGGVNEK